MQKIEELEHLLIDVIREFAEDNSDINIAVDSDYFRGTIKIKVEE